MKNKISDYITETMQEVQLPKKVESLSNNINMTYNYITDKISFDPSRIQYNLKKYPLISLKDYVITFTLHELGHSLDRDNLLNSYEQTLEWFKLSKKLNKHEKARNLKYLKLCLLEDHANLAFEKEAWNNAIHLNNEFQLVPMDTLEHLKSDSLFTYEQRCEDSKRLIEAYQDQTALTV